MLNIVLFEPLIPQNTGNIGRLCVAINASLHLIKPLGFDLSEKALRRAGLDYWKHLNLQLHESYEDFRETVPGERNLWFISKFGKKTIHQVSYQKNDFIVFGQETKGLAPYIHKQEPKECFLQIPMFSQNVRSLNLANSVSITAYEAVRQLNS